MKAITLLNNRVTRILLILVVTVACYLPHSHSQNTLAISPRFVLYPVLNLTYSTSVNEMEVRYTIINNTKGDATLVNSSSFPIDSILLRVSDTQDKNICEARYRDSLQRYSPDPQTITIPPGDSYSEYVSLRLLFHDVKFVPGDYKLTATLTVNDTEIEAEPVRFRIMSLKEAEDRKNGIMVPIPPIGGAARE